MNKHFRALGTLASLFKVVAWIILVVGVAATILAAAVGILQSRRGVSGLLVNVPVLNRTAGLVEALLLAGGMLVGTLLVFVLIYALAEVIQVALAIEMNTRETSYFLKGEAQLPPPPVAKAWSEEETPPPTAAN